MTQSNEKSVCQCDADWTDGTPYCQQCGLERAPSVEPAAQPQPTMQSFAKEMTEYDFEPSLELDKEQLRKRSEPAAEVRRDEPRTLLDMAANKLESSEYPSDLHLAATIRKHLAARASGTGHDAKAQLISKDAASMDDKSKEELDAEAELLTRLENELLEELHGWNPWQQVGLPCGVEMLADLLVEERAKASTRTPAQPSEPSTPLGDRDWQCPTCGQICLLKNSYKHLCGGASEPPKEK